MLLSIQDLQVAFRLGERGAKTLVPAVKRVSFDIPENTTLALVGESGSGKSVTAMSILNLLPDNAQRSGRILWQGRDLLAASRPELQALRGREIACVFQDPMSSLNPVFTVGTQLCEPLIKHLGLGRRAALARAEELLAETGLPEPRRRLAAYPHELSGGMRQRAMISMALACEPKLLIADEPTTALDVTIQAQILEIMKDLKNRRNMSIVLITHDLGIVSDICDKIIIMYSGEIMEYGPIETLFANPKHPYTIGLIRSLPKIDQKEGEPLTPIEGSPVDLMHPPAGCPFAPRCEHCMKVCLTEKPPYFELEPGHYSACWLQYDRKER